jgi:rubrerythrin
VGQRRDQVLREVPKAIRQDRRQFNLPLVAARHAVEWLCTRCGYRWEGSDVPASCCPGCDRKIIAANETA